MKQTSPKLLIPPLSVLSLCTVWAPGNTYKTSKCLQISKTLLKKVIKIQFSSLMSDSLQPHESQHVRPPCPSPTPGVYPNPCPLSRWCHPAISSSVIPFSSCFHIKISSLLNNICLNLQSITLSMTKQHRP